MGMLNKTLNSMEELIAKNGIAFDNLINSCILNINNSVGYNNVTNMNPYFKNFITDAINNNIGIKDKIDDVIYEWKNSSTPNDFDWFGKLFEKLTEEEFVRVLIMLKAKEVDIIKRMINNGASKEDIINTINSKYIKMYIRDWDKFIDAIDKNVIISNPTVTESPKVESSAAKVFNPEVFLEPVVQQNVMQPQAPQHVQQPAYQAPQPQQQTPQSVVLHPQCRPGNNVRILNYDPINPMEYNGFYGLFMDQFNNQVYLPVARPQYANIENSFGCLLDNNSTNNDTTKIVEYLRKHVKFINPGKNNFTLTEVLSLINLVKNNAKVKEYCEKYESIYNPSSIILNEVTDKYVLKGTKYNKAFSIDTQDAEHPIIVFYNTKPYYNGIINGWINESAITVKK